MESSSDNWGFVDLGESLDFLPAGWFLSLFLCFLFVLEYVVY